MGWAQWQSYGQASGPGNCTDDTGGPGQYIMLLRRGPAGDLIHELGPISVTGKVGPDNVFWCQEWADARQINRVGLCEVHSRRGWAHVTPYPEIQDMLLSASLAGKTCMATHNADESWQPSITEQARLNILLSAGLAGRTCTATQNADETRQPSITEQARHKHTAVG
ncbi:hypothetical protein C8R48DRAFT_676564 [Suillus tomentosus]|nr:hypothetical protein C8R48DRAFT_676564 [Suillus tomentosus]